jgi:hypothetical protein
MLAIGTFPRLCCGAVAIALLLTAAYARGQRPIPGAIRGAVVDQSHSPLPGVVVTLTREGEHGQHDRNAFTDQNGDYQVTQVEPGSYSVTFALTGLRIPAREGVIVGDEAVRVDAVAVLDGCIDIRPGEVCVDDAFVLFPADWSDVPCDTIGLSDHGGMIFFPGAIHSIEFKRSGRS